MVNRRRSAKPRLSVLLLGLLSPLTWANQLEVQSPHSALRFEVPDALYQAGATTDFSALQILDSQGQNLAYAVCAERDQSSARTRIPVMGLPDLSRPQLNPEGQLSFSSPAGVSDTTPQIVDWVLDLRRLKGATGTLIGLPAVAELRISPNLQQWSAPIEFQQNGDMLMFEPRPLSFVRIRPSNLPDAGASTPNVLAEEEQRSDARAVHWFDPPQDEQGLFLNPRRLPIFAARLKNDVDVVSSDWALQSRQGAWDAWKPRGRMKAGELPSLLRFSAVTDPQWRIPGNAAAALELGHARYELRIPEIAHPGALRMRLHERGGFGPSLSCRSTEQLAPQAPQSITTLDEAISNDGSSQPGNLRNFFLLVLAIVVTAGVITRRFLLRRQGR